MVSYLSKAANSDPTSRIRSGGPKGGYWVEPVEEAAPVEKEQDVQPLSTGKGKAVQFYEKDLYPLVELWMEQRGFTAKDVSSVKSGGKWGNPDIIGAERTEVFGAIEIEMASCEVKLSSDSWEQVIFEAISHKRFANRSWYCYRTSLEASPLPKGMEYYAERYRVGVVQIELTDDELLSLKNGSAQPIDYLENVIERVPAIYDFVPLKEQRDLVDRTGLSMTLTF